MPRGPSSRRRIRTPTDQLFATPVTGGKYTVILDPLLAGLFIHEAFGHRSEADSLCEDERMKEVMRLGKRFGSDRLNVVDDGSVPGRRGTHRYDHEGVKTGRAELIREGILVGRLHSRETAALMGESPTGNARAVGFQHAPIVRMTNTFIEAGSDSLEDLIGDIELGVFARDGFGGQVDMEMFTFSAAHGHMIRKGAVAEPVRDVVLTGNVFETLFCIEGVGADFVWDPGAGPYGCGKSGQYPLPVGSGSPHIRIRDVLIGGRQ
ncbi:MAG: TldD/PmbA family protein [Planctomycetota bacterium]